jgi:ABC-2 type transport system permease protein
MRAYWTLTRRELGSYFLSSTGYLIIADLFYGTWYFWLVLLLTTPVITMRLFALEKFSGTFETLMTAPVNDREVVLAKFTAGLLFYVVMWVPLQASLFLVRHYTNDSAVFDVWTLGSTLLGILLLGGLFISLGCCASALTRSQVAAATISLAFGTSLFLLGLLADHLPSQTTWQTQVLAALGFFNQMQDFVRGVVDTRAVVLYLSSTLFFLFLTLRIIESRRWK